jgi:hypothetical protein
MHIGNVSCFKFSYGIPNATPNDVEAVAAIISLNHDNMQIRDMFSRRARLRRMEVIT